MLRGGSLRLVVLPGLAFQGVVMGGGYATGRELVEFFMRNGPVGGLLGMAVTAAVWSLVAAMAFELCRRHGAYDYRAFFKILLGRFWILYEVLNILLMFLVLAVVSAAAGEIMAARTGAPAALGALLLFLLVAGLCCIGNRMLGAVMMGLAGVVYLFYIAVFLLCATVFHERIMEALAHGPARGTWAYDGLRYAGYNVACLPLIFFSLRELATRRQAWIAGGLAGVIGMLPAACLFLALLSLYPEVTGAPVPMALLLAGLDVPGLALAFDLLLFATLAQTGAGLIHAYNERLAGALRERHRALPRTARVAVVALAALLAAAVGTRFGLPALVAQGYGLITFGFLATFVAPLLLSPLRSRWRSTKKEPA